MKSRELKVYIQKKSREEKLRHFYRHVAEPGAILDVGVSRLELHNRRGPANYFLKTFRYPAEFYTGLAVDDMTGMDELHPGKKFVTYDGRIFPFADHQFDSVFSNAVVEHVGDSDRQLLFINEMLRVGKWVFFTTPNKWFPIETHTGAFIRHWSDASFFKWCSKHHPHYTKSNLNLLGYDDVDRLMKQSDAGNYKIHRNHMFGMTMTFTVTGSRA
jgi:SAM-dependent methyltransferase